MTSEHLLDAIGLLDDGLIREAEAYQPPRRDYSRWISLAASAAVVLTLGYGAFQLKDIGMGGGAAPENQGSGGAAGAPGSSVGIQGVPSAGVESPDNSFAGGASDMELPPAAEPADPCLPEETENLAVLIDGGLYRSTGESVRLSPDEGEVRYGLSWVIEESWESSPEPDRRWLMLEDGRAAVLWDVEEWEWLIFAPAVEP